MPTAQFSNFRLHREPAWRPMVSKSDRAIPDQWRDWLSDTGSLTQRLLDASDGKLSVQIIRQCLDAPRLSERLALGLAPRRLALIREVILLGDGVPWVYARSVLPMTTLTGSLRKLRRLDNRPLGALLFQSPSMTREPVEVACHTSANAKLPVVLGHIDTPLWGRRSVFRLNRKPLLVSEIFLPDFKPYNQSLPFGYGRNL